MEQPEKVSVNTVEELFTFLSQWHVDTCTHLQGMIESLGKGTVRLDLQVDENTVEVANADQVYGFVRGLTEALEHFALPFTVEHTNDECETD